MTRNGTGRDTRLAKGRAKSLIRLRDLDTVLALLDGDVRCDATVPREAFGERVLVRREERAEERTSKPPATLTRAFIRAATTRRASRSGDPFVCSSVRDPTPVRGGWRDPTGPRHRVRRVPDARVEDHDTPGLGPPTVVLYRTPPGLPPGARGALHSCGDRR